MPKTSLLVILRSLLPEFPCIDQGSQPLNKEEKSSEEALGSQPGAALTPSRSPSFPGCQRGRRLITEAGVCMRRGRHSRFPGVCLPSEAHEFLTPGRDGARGRDGSHSWHRSGHTHPQAALQVQRDHSPARRLASEQVDLSGATQPRAPRGPGGVEPSPALGRLRHLSPGSVLGPPAKMRVEV